MAAYSDDAFGRVVAETAGGVTQNFVYDGANLALVLNSSGQVTERELYAAAVDAIMASEAVSRVDSGPQSAGTVSWMLGDNQGTIRDVVQGVLSGSTMTADVVDHVIFDAYGNASQGAGFTSDPLPQFGFDGMRYDAATGLNITEHRFYDPRTGNWISQDPLGFNGGQTNLSEFVGNSPTNATDPTGMAQSWRSSAFATIDNWSSGPNPAVNTGWQVIDAPGTFFTNLFGNAIAKPVVWLGTNWRQDTAEDRINTINAAAGGNRSVEPDGDRTGHPEPVLCFDDGSNRHRRRRLRSL